MHILKTNLIFMKDSLVLNVKHTPFDKNVNPEIFNIEFNDSERNA